MRGVLCVGGGLAVLQILWVGGVLYASCVQFLWVGGVHIHVGGCRETPLMHGWGWV